MQALKSADDLTKVPTQVLDAIIIQLPDIVKFGKSVNSSAVHSRVVFQQYMWGNSNELLLFSTNVFVIETLKIGQLKMR